MLDSYTVVPTTLPCANRLERPDGQRRVLLLLPWMQVGGADRFALDLVAGLTTGGDRVTVCLLRDAVHSWLPELQSLSEDVFNLPAFVTVADYPRFLHYLIESRQITTVLISNALLGYQLLPYLRSRCPTVAVVDYIHAEETWRAGGYARAAVDHDGLIDLHITSSHHLRRWLHEQGVDETRTATCYIGIDTQRWQLDAAVRAQVRAAYGIAADTPVIVFAARLSSEKRPELVAHILRDLRDSGRRFVCLVVGDGAYRRWLERFVRRHGLGDCVQILGALAHSRVRDVLAGSDILLLPSAREGVALTVYEALAMAVVPVAADVGGQRELVTPDCGVLVAPGVDEQASYVAALARLIDDPHWRSDLSQAGRARVAAHFSAAHTLARMQELLDTAHTNAQTMPLPQVSMGAGTTTAVLAVEHYQLETRLRGLLPVRLVLRLRQSAWWRPITSVLGLRASIGRVDRTLYVVRRVVMQRLKRWRRGDVG